MCWPFRKKRKSLTPIIKNVIDGNFIKDFCYEWNTRYPIDRWWRNKHKIAFNSPEHRVVSFIDMRIEWEEDMLFKPDLRKDYEADKGEWMHEDIVTNEYENLTQEEILKKELEAYSKMDLTQYNDPVENG